MPRPNILYIMTNQQRADTIVALGVTGFPENPADTMESFLNQWNSRHA